ncbi:MAG: aminopeptidase P family N-terminal domain-containing protein, partial [Anaerolineae bacterium]|nr:aminopeptidase P family N-terminal domain-containing protein [Anaerolineae bacterium]
MLTHDALKRDVARRIQRIQAMMKEKELGALIVVGQAQPGGIGAIRYITHAHIWGGAAYAILGADDPHPWLQVWSSYQSIWSRNETTTLPERVESPDNIVSRTTELAKGYAGTNRRIGMVNMNKLMSIGEYQKFTKAL